jgi:hypothetical protein
MEKLTREDVVEAARKAQEETNGPLTHRKFIQVSGITAYKICRLFPEGRWTEIRDLAGIERHHMDRKEYSDDELLMKFHSVVESVGKIPTWAIFDSRSDVSSYCISKRFGGLQGTVRRYSRWLKEHHPENPLLNKLNVQSKHEIPTPPTAQSLETDRAQTATWDKVDGSTYGPPIDFRGLRHAPINEQGVVFLFGMVSYELGFIVEAVHATFPDCEAKRCIDERNQRWQRVRIEFEYKSRSFRDHGHDSNGCDLIVCWEHNWSECPIEVVELRKVIDKLEG